MGRNSPSWPWSFNLEIPPLALEPNGAHGQISGVRWSAFAGRCSTFLDLISLTACSSHSLKLERQTQKPAALDEQKGAASSPALASKAQRCAGLRARYPLGHSGSCSETRENPHQKSYVQGAACSVPASQFTKACLCAACWKIVITISRSYHQAIIESREHHHTRRQARRADRQGLAAWAQIREI